MLALARRGHRRPNKSIIKPMEEESCEEGGEADTSSHPAAPLHMQRASTLHLPALLAAPPTSKVRRANGLTNPVNSDSTCARKHAVARTESRNPNFF